MMGGSATREGASTRVGLGFVVPPRARLGLGLELWLGLGLVAPSAVDNARRDLEF